jgi:hypothetical protein
VLNFASRQCRFTALATLHIDAGWWLCLTVASGWAAVSNHAKVGSVKEKLRSQPLRFTLFRCGAPRIGKRVQDPRPAIQVFDVLDSSVKI